MEQKDSEMNMVELRMMEVKLENLMRQRELLANRLAEIEGTAASIEDISKAKSEVLFHVGGEAFMPAKPLNENKIIVMLGADVAIERNIEDAKKILESRKKEAEGILVQVQNEIERLTKEATELAQKIEEGHDHG